MTQPPITPAEARAIRERLDRMAAMTRQQVANELLTEHQASRRKPAPSTTLPQVVSSHA